MSSGDVHSYHTNVRSFATSWPFCQFKFRPNNGYHVKVHNKFLQISKKRLFGGKGTFVLNTKMRKSLVKVHTSYSYISIARIFTQACMIAWRPTHQKITQDEFFHALSLQNDGKRENIASSLKPSFLVVMELSFKFSTKYEHVRSLQDNSI